MKSHQIRQSFIDFFEQKDHHFVRSSPVVPTDDPTLLFINAGMNQFKPVFLGKTKSKYPRAVNSQKCIRVSGKHNDLEEVGVDTFHHTFFEMLGNWSFGDYYKKEAIQWAWELFTVHWKLDKSRLWATVYEEDDEAFDLWLKHTDIAPERVIRCGKKDNFWEMGETGPCGPCSEIHYYVGDNPDNQVSSGVNNLDEYWELWNLVFIQHNRLEDGSLEDLPEKHVDTGAGLERIASVMQGKSSNYDSDLFLPIIQEIESISGKSYLEDPIPFRVIADHIRMLCFSLADGALPSNDGRGYVLRRILRRAARFGRTLGLSEPFLYQLVQVVGDIMNDIFPEVLQKQPHLEKVIKSEEISFNKTLGRGLNHFEKLISNLGGTKIDGNDAFKLYDTYGFPLDLTELLARERKLTVDVEGFHVAMASQKQRAKEAGKFKTSEESVQWKIVSDGHDSEFLGYDVLESNSVIRRYTKVDNQHLVVLDKTPFYAESGGQVGDTGTIIGDGINLTVVDVKKDENSIIHICDGELSNDGPIQAIVDLKRREAIRKNHTATHLMHKALKQVLGAHVNQAGSLVHPEYLRFDLTHFEKITDDQINQIELIVNEQILINTSLGVEVKGFDEAKAEGAEALFGEKYGEKVRVIKIGEFSIELCGGTHVNKTGDIGSFKIVDESSLSSGVRRIVAVTGQKSIEKMQYNAGLLKALQLALNTSSDTLLERVQSLLKEKKNLEKQLKQKQSAPDLSQSLFDNVDKIDGKTVLIKQVNSNSMNELKQLGDELFNKLESGIGVLFMMGEQKPSAVIVVSKDLNEHGIFAGNLAKDIGGFMGAGGGGKPHLATAGGRTNDLIPSAMKQTKTLIVTILKG